MSHGLMSRERREVQTAGNRRRMTRSEERVGEMAVTHGTVASTMLYQSLFNILLGWHDVQCHIYSFYHIHTQIRLREQASKKYQENKNTIKL